VGVITKRVNRYYCEYCGKSGCAGGHMRNHEQHCTKNPNRVCGMCAIAQQQQAPMEALRACLPDPANYVQVEHSEFGDFEIYTNLASAVAARVAENRRRLPCLYSVGSAPGRDTGPVLPR